MNKTGFYCLAVIIAIQICATIISFFQKSYVQQLVPEEKDRQAIKQHVQHEKSSPKTLAFHLDRSKFINDIAQCVRDFYSPDNVTRCHLMYQHVGKTGGTNVENLFFSLVDYRYPTCCERRMRERFDAAPMDYCTLPFQPYQAVGNFYSIVDTCNKLYFSKQPEGKKPRVLLLTTIREPIEKTHSAIHQACNKLVKAQSNETMEACRTCNFQSHPDFWMRQVKSCNIVYSVLRNTTTRRLRSFDQYWLDLVDLQDMTDELERILSPESKRLKEGFLLYHSKSHNPEKLDVCNFGFTTEMSRGLKPSKIIYRDFLLGKLWDQ